MRPIRLFHRGSPCVHAAWLVGLGLWLGCGSTPTTTQSESADRSGTPPSVSATAAAADASPNYLWSFDNLRLLVDANLVVQDSSSGNIVLRLANKDSQPGEEWKTFDVSDACCQQYTYGTLHALYNTATPASTGRITSSGEQVLPWRAFGLLGKMLPTKRQLIVRRQADSGQPAYALFEFVFPGPQ